MSTLFVILLISAFTVTKEGYKIGDIAEDFSLKNIDDNMVSLSDYKEAKGFIITFTYNTCPFTIAYEDRIIPLDKKYAENGHPVIAIMPNNVSIQPGDAMPEIKKRAESKGFTFPYLIDDNYKDASAVTTKYVENAIDALLSGNEIKEKETKAIVAQ